MNHRGIPSKLDSNFCFELLNIHQQCNICHIATNTQRLKPRVAQNSGGVGLYTFISIK